MVSLCLRSSVWSAHIPMQTPPSFWSNHTRESRHVLMHTKSRKRVLRISASVRDGYAHCSGRSQLSVPPWFQLWNPSPVLRARGGGLRAASGQPCCARLEKHISNNLALSSCKSRGPCQVPVFDSPLYQAVASSFPGHPATFQREQDWWCLGQHRHTARWTSNGYEPARTINSVEELSY